MFPIRFILHIATIVFAAAGIFLVACGLVPSLPSIPGLGGSPTPSRQITYDGAVALNVANGSTLPGTTIAYDGKSPDGRAIMKINGLQSIKSNADSVNWSGALVLFSLVDLNLRVLTYDNSGMNLAGTIHLVVQDPNPTPSDPSSNPMADFTIPVTYTVQRNATIPGTTVSYVGADESQGAQFANLDQFPYRQRFDSVVWQGHLRDRIALRLDSRVLDFNNDRVVLAGTARVIFEQ